MARQNRGPQAEQPNSAWPFSYQRIAKGASGKGPGQKTSKIVKKCQKVLSGMARVRLADLNGPKWTSPGQNGGYTFRQYRGHSLFFDTFRQFSRGTFFPAPFGGLRSYICSIALCLCQVTGAADELANSMPGCKWQIDLSTRAGSLQESLWGGRDNWRNSETQSGVTILAALYRSPEAPARKVPKKCFGKCRSETGCLGKCRKSAPGSVPM